MARGPARRPQVRAGGRGHGTPSCASAGCWKPSWTGRWMRRWPGCRGRLWGGGGWMPSLEGVYERRWEQQIEPYGPGLAEFAAIMDPGLRVCLELHPGTCVFNVETFTRVASLGPSIGANLDPSHFFWMGMDGHRVAAALGDRVGHVHGKDTVFHADSLALNGLLDRRWPEPAARMPWTFALPGRGHDLAWWTGLVVALAASAAQVA